MNRSNEVITAFVRNVLGCGCPDEVFNKIEVSDINLVPEISTATRIVVGDTLLIYILQDSQVEVVADNIGKLVNAGKHDRDSHGYNRFRLVMLSSDRKDQEERIDAMFVKAASGDEKLHLHFIDSDVLGNIDIC